MPDISSDAGNIPASSDFTSDLNSTFADDSSSTVDTSTVDRSGDAGYQQSTDATPPERLTQAPDLTDPAELAPPVTEVKPPERAAEPELDPDEEIVPTEATFRGKKEHHYTIEQSQRLQADKKVVRELREAIPDFTVEQAKQHYQSDTNLQMILTDYLHGGTDRLASELMRISHEAQSPDAFPQLALGMAKTLYDTNPQAWHAVIAQPVINQHMTQYLDSLQVSRIQDLAAAQRSGDESRIRSAAHGLYWAQQQAYKETGRYKTPEGYQAEANSRPAEPTPQEREVTQRLQRYEANEQLQYRQAVQGWNKTFDAERDSRVRTVIDQALQGAKDHLPKTETQQAAWKNHILTLVKDKVEQDADFKARFELDRQSALRTQDNGLREAALGKWSNRAQAIARGELKKLIAEHTAQVLSTNGQTHQRLAAASARTEPGGGATPVPRSIAPSPSQANSKVNFLKELDEAFANV